MTSFGRLTITNFENHARGMDMFRINQKRIADIHQVYGKKKEQRPDLVYDAQRLERTYDRPTTKALTTDRSRTSIQYQMRNRPLTDTPLTVTTSQRKNVFLSLVEAVRGAPTSDSESPYPYKDTEFERKHGDEIGVLSAADPRAPEIKFTVKPVAGVMHTVQLVIQSPRDQPLVLKYGRADGHHHPTSREVINECYIDGMPNGEYVFIVGHPTVSVHNHSINLNEPFTRLDYNSVPPVDHTIPAQKRPAPRPHRVGAVRRV